MTPSTRKVSSLSLSSPSSAINTGPLGGPLKRDKTFFFLYYEGLRERAGETRQTTVPSLNERVGNFGELCTSAAGTFDSSGMCSNPNGQLYNVFAPSPQPLPFNQVPFISPISQNLLAFFPAPNTGSNTFVSTLSKSTDNDQFGVRFDHYLTPRDTLNFGYIFSQGNVVDPLSTSGANVPGFPVGEEHRSQNFVATETHTFSPSLVALGRISFLRNRFFFDEHINHTDPASRIPAKPRCRVWSSLRSGCRIRRHRRSHHRAAAKLGQ